jgi:hypothetical protein
MSNESVNNPQNLLAAVYELAKFTHELRNLATEARQLLEQAERNAVNGGLPPSLVAKAAGLTAGRITQILARPAENDLPPRALADRSYKILEWPADALKRHSASFSGEMTYPPYPAGRRARVSSVTVMHG